MTGTIETPSAALVSVCCICGRRILADGYGHGERMAPAENHSHGVCLHCAPDYCRQLGLSEEQTARLINSEVKRRAA